MDHKEDGERGRKRRFMKCSTRRTSGFWVCMTPVRDKAQPPGNEASLKDISSYKELELQLRKEKPN